MITLVVARADNGIIGREDALPWRLPADLARFKAITMGHSLLMGRRTFESIGRPLPGRRSIVLTRGNWTHPGVEVAPTLMAGLALAGPDVMVIGGAQIYAQALHLAGRVELTEVHAAPEGDTSLPAFDPACWCETRREDYPAQDARPAFSFVTLERR